MSIEIVIAAQLFNSGVAATSHASSGLTRHRNRSLNLGKLDADVDFVSARIWTASRGLEGPAERRNGPSNKVGVPP